MTLAPFPSVEAELVFFGTAHSDTFNIQSKQILLFWNFNIGVHRTSVTLPWKKESSGDCVCALLLLGLLVSFPPINPLLVCILQRMES